jgi:DNA-binding SARP family transcriptional activator
MMHVNLFGNFRISIDEKPVTTVNTNRLQSLLSYLILHFEAPQPRDALAFTLWPASRESQARTNLRQLVHNLRRALPVECDSLVTDHFTVQWRRDGSCQVDTWQFQSAIADAAIARNDSNRTREIASLTKAAALYADDLLPALYDDWILPFRDEYRRSVCEALDHLATILEEQREYAAAIPYADRLLVLDPLGEAHHRLLILCILRKRKRVISEEDFQCQLNDAWVVGTEKISKARAAYRGNRIQEIGVIEGVEEFAAKLKAPALGNGKVFE